MTHEVLENLVDDLVGRCESVPLLLIKIQQRVIHASRSPLENRNEMPIGGGALRKSDVEARTGKGESTKTLLSLGRIDSRSIPLNYK